MELLQLRYFYESACNESITKTANQYMVPPSSVSLSIKRLEQELGCQLFDRSGNRIRLNANGRLLQKALQLSLGELDGVVEALTASHGEQKGEISLLVRCNRRMLLEQMQEFRTAHPGVVFRLSHDFSTSDLDRFDLIVDAPSAEYHSFAGEPILREAIRIAASTQNPLCGRTLTMRDLREQPFITMCKGSSMHRITVECCKKAGFHPNIVIESDDPLYLRKYIELDFGVAFIPSVSWQGQMENTCCLNVTDLHEQRVTYVYRNRFRRLSLLAKAFYEMLLDCRGERPL